MFMKMRNKNTVVGNIVYGIPETTKEDKIDIKTIKPKIHEPIQLDQPTIESMKLGYVPQYDFKRMSESEPQGRYLTVEEPVEQWTPESVLESYKDELKQKEGLRLRAYRDSGGVWTIGYGHTKDVKPGDHITEEEAERLLNEDIDSHASWLKDQISTHDLSEGQFLALFDYGYNAGVGSLRKLMANADKNTMKSRLSNWGLRDRSGQVLKGLVDRANWRVQMFG